MPVRSDSDSSIAARMPNYTIVSASAGSGKTTELTRRMAQYLLSRRIPRNRLKNILAITFTNNAAKEMKRRVLQTLKKARLGDEKILKELGRLLTGAAPDVRNAAGAMVDQLMDDYTDFQVQTIDSFLARVFGASAVDFGFTPDFDLLLAGDSLLNEAVERFSRDILPGNAKWGVVEDLVRLIDEGRSADRRYIWNPSDDLAKQIKKIYRTIVRHAGPLIGKDLSAAVRQEGEELVRLVVALDDLIDTDEISKNANFQKYAAAARREDIEYLTSHSLPDPPVNKTKVKGDIYQKWVKKTSSLTGKIANSLLSLRSLQAQQYYYPYTQGYEMLLADLEAVRRKNGEVDIGDVTKRLAEFLTAGAVPELYFKLGDEISHFLIDEFQDTSPIQWQVLKPLIENSLSQGGSFFAVGDTKQSIYSFRGADWRIMKKLIEEDVFPMAGKEHRELGINYRSNERIVEFTKTVFQDVVPAIVRSGAEEASGLSTYVQKPATALRHKGYAEVTLLEKGEDKKAEQERLLAILEECRLRGYSHREIAILTPRNDDVVEVSGWLNRMGIQFISHSSLDIRRRGVIAEVLALLRFLDSPVDNLAFASFLMSDLFSTVLAADRSAVTGREFHQFIYAHRSPTAGGAWLYVAFRQSFPELWRTYFEEPFRLVGYLPLYDLVTELFKIFRVFDTKPDDEAALVKFLEVVHDFETTGGTDLKDFLRSSEDDSDDDKWNLSIPAEADAVQVMTIHKAKGLGFRVVIVLLYDTSPRPDSLYVHHDDDGVVLVRLTKDIEHVEGLSDLYLGKRMRDEVDRLNKLYVALTRAEKELYVIAVKGGRGRQPSEFLPATGFEPRSDKPKAEPGIPRAEDQARIHHHNERSVQKPGEQFVAIAEASRGEFVHNVLARIEYRGSNLRQQIEEALAAERLLSRESLTPGGRDDVGSSDEELAKQLEQFLSRPEISEFFAEREGRTVLNECEFADREGGLVRMDRVVVDSNAIVVVDYKTGGENPAYVEQIRRYKTILRDVYPGREVKGMLAYVDTGAYHHE